MLSIWVSYESISPVEPHSRFWGLENAFEYLKSLPKLQPHSLNLASFILKEIYKTIFHHPILTVPTTSPSPFPPSLHKPNFLYIAKLNPLFTLPLPFHPPLLIPYPAIHPPFPSPATPPVFPSLPTNLLRWVPI